MHSRLMRTTLTVLALLCLTVAAQAAWIGLDGSDQPAAPRITVTDAAVGRTVIEVEVAGLEIETVTINGQDHAQLILPGHVQLLDQGMPAVP